MTAVSLWWGLVNTVAAQAAAAGQDWLSATERNRLATLTSPQRRAQFLAGRWGARHLLAATQGGDALADWCLSAEPEAPPRVERGLHAMHVAISHSHHRVACAVSAYERPVGLDLEVPRHARDTAALSAAVCTAAEQARLLALPTAQRAPHFYRIWTLKEAWLKRRGEGVSMTRLASLHTHPASSEEQSEGHLWHSHEATLALLAPAGMPWRWLDAPADANPGPERWHVDERHRTH